MRLILLEHNFELTGMDVLKNTVGLSKLYLRLMMNILQFKKFNIY